MPIAVRSLLLALLLAGASTVAGSTRAQVTSSTTSTPLPPVQTVVSSVEAVYSAASTFRSDFDQSFLIKAYSVTRTSQGHVTFAKPGMMDWDYTNPAGNRVVSNGTTLSVYSAADKQVLVKPMSITQYPALSFLTGQGKLSQSFNFQIAAGQSMGFPNGYVLIGTPIVPTAAYEKVLFYVDMQSFQVRRVLILDAQGNRNRFDFVNPTVNVPVAPAQFVFSPPPGTTVVP